MTRLFVGLAIFTAFNTYVLFGNLFDWYIARDEYREAKEEGEDIATGWLVSFWVRLVLFPLITLVISGIQIL